MSARRSTSASPASGSKRSRSPDTLEEAWRRQCKLSAAGSRRAACRYAGCLYVPPKLREFAVGGRWYKEDPPLKPMSGPDFEKWRADWEMHRRAKVAWAAQIGSTSGGGAGEEEEEAEEGDDSLYLQAVAASKKDAAEAARAEEEEVAAAIAAMKEMEAREAAARAPFFIRDE